MERKFVELKLIWKEVKQSNQRGKRKRQTERGGKKIKRDQLQSCGRGEKEEKVEQKEEREGKSKNGEKLKKWRNWKRKEREIGRRMIKGNRFYCEELSLRIS